MATPAKLIHIPAKLIYIKENVYRMVDTRGIGYYFYVKCSTGGYTYHQTLEDAEKAAQAELQD